MLHSEVENRERCAGVQAFTQKEDLYSPEHQRNVKPPKAGPPSASALFSGNQPSNTMCCTFCKQPHQPAKLPCDDQQSSKKRMPKKQSCCFVCLKGSHLARDCPCNMSCLKCSGKHHVGLCERSPQEHLESTVSQNHPMHSFHFLSPTYC